MRYSILTALLFCAIATFAQDLIIPKNGDPIKAYNTEVGSTHLFYQLEDDAVIIRIPKSDVLMVRKADGTVLDLTNNESNNIEAEEEDDGFPFIPEDSIKGLLIAEGNCVFIPTDSPKDYERAGQEALKQGIKKWGFWNVVNNPEKSHFILQFVTNTHGFDKSWIVLRPRKYYRISHDLIDRETAGLMIAFTGSNEDIEDNRKVATKLLGFLKKVFSDSDNKDTKIYLKQNLYKYCEASAFEEGGIKTPWIPKHIF